MPDRPKHPKLVVALGTGARSMRALTRNFEPGAVEDPVQDSPEFSGLGGKAWSADFIRLRPRPDTPDATIASWVVEATWAHPAWHSYWIALGHLRPLTGFPPPHVFLAGATHEFHVAALCPDSPRQPVVRGLRPPKFLTPINFAAQLVAENDEAARERVALAVREICEARLSPDTDARADWVRRFGANMMAP